MDFASSFVLNSTIFVIILSVILEWLNFAHFISNNNEWEAASIDICIFNKFLSPMFQASKTVAIIHGVR